MDQLPGDFKPKSFWARPEGTTGMLIVALLLFAGALGLYTILPFLITLLQNTLHAAALFGACAAIFYVVTNRRLRTLVSYGFKSLMRALTGILITIDPIGILKNYIRDLNDNLEDMSRQLGRLKGEITRLKRTIETNEEQAKENLALAAEAKKRAGKEGMKAQVYLQTRQAGRLQKSNVTLQSLYTKMEVLYRLLRKMYENSQILLQDMEGEVDVKEREYNAMKAGYSAFRSAYSIIKGDPDKRALFEQTMEYLTDDYGRKMGEIEHFMDISRGFLDSIDLQNQVFDEKALAMLTEWEQKTDSVLLGDEKQQLIAKAYDPEDVINLDASAEVKQKDKGKGYDQLLNQ